MVDTLTTEQVALSALVGMKAPYNPRKISAHDLAALQRSLERFGVVEPIVANSATQHIVGGHQRIAAAQKLGLESLPVVWVDLNGIEEKQLNLALNRISGEWDDDKLAAILEELTAAGADLGLTGFQDDELDRLIDAVTKHGDPDAVPPVEKIAFAQRGDLIVLGQHRLACGDSTLPADVAVLMDGEKAAAVWTDPPYGVNYKGGTVDALTIQNDDPEGLPDLLSETFARVAEFTQPGSPVYIAHPSGPLSAVFLRAFMGAGWRLHQTLVWVKDQLVLGHSDYHYRHEPLLYGYTAGGGPRGRGRDGWYGDNSQTSVFEIPRPKASPDHPTGKPVALVAACLGNSTRRGDIVLEPFCGSGSTLIAAEDTGRRCFGMEIDPLYVDVIVRRWQDFTGKKAEGWRGR